jgi:pimeloyl-ACP methyl ester carboxylesterase
MSYNWRLHESGSGSTVLLLHAFPFDARMWDAQMKALAASHRVIAPDMPGFGGAPSWVEAPNVDSWASSLLERLRADGVQDAIVAGCSVGGYFAFAMLRTASNFIRGLALVDTRAIPDTPGRKAARLADAERIAREGRAFFIDAAREDLSVELAAYPSSLAAANAMLDDVTGDGIIGALCAMAERPDARSQLPTITVPVAVVRGALDPIVGADEARSLAAAIRGATFNEIDGAGHIPTFQRPEAVTAALFTLSSRTA